MNSYRRACLRCDPFVLEKRATEISVKPFSDQGSLKGLGQLGL